MAIWDPSGEHVHDCLHYDWGDPYPMPAGAQMYDFALPNGTKAHMIEPLRSFHLQYRNAAHGLYENRNCELDAVWTALMPPHDTGLPQGQDEWGRGHYEQPGRLKGTLKLNGETIPLDCFCERDRSWGRRRVAQNPRGFFPWAIASDTCAFHLFGASNLPPEKDDGLGPDPILSGWYLKDGACGSITSGTRAIVERGRDGRPLRVHVRATDNLGRTLDARGRTTNMLVWNGYSYLFMWWAQVEWQFDGLTAYGEEQDWWPMQQAREFLRARVNR